MRIKKLFSFMLALLMITGMLSACASGTTTPGSTNPGTTTPANNSETPSSGAAKSSVLRIAHWFADNHPQHISLQKFEELVEKGTNGNIDVQIYPNCQLGSEETFNDSVKNGTLEMCAAGTMFSKYYKPVSTPEIPFLFTDWDSTQAILTGDIGSEITAGLIEAAGVRNLGYTVNGFSEFSSNCLIDSLDDFKGLKFRCANVDYHVKMMEALGTNPTPLAFSEVFSALESKVVIGQYNPYPTIWNSSFYEVQSNILESHHMFHPILWLMNENYFQSLSADTQKVILDSAKEAQAYNWQLSREQDEECKQKLTEAGVTITVPSEEFHQQMVDSQKEVREFFYSQYPGTEEFVAKIQKYQEEHK